MSTPSVIIQQFKVAYHVPRTLRDFASIHDRLDDILRTQLERAWDRSVLSGETEESYCFIDRLEFSFSIDLAASDDHTIAHRWAVRLYDAIDKKIRSGTGVVFFEDRAHYLAAFVRALLQGTAAGDPCFRELLSFGASESISIAVPLLSATPDVGRDALLLLARAGALSLFLDRLPDAAIQQLWSSCIAPASSAPVFTGSYPVWVRRLLVFLNRFSLEGKSESHDLMTLHLEFLGANPDLGPDSNLALFHRELIRLRYAASPSPPSSAQQTPAQPDSSSEMFLRRLTAKVDEADVSSLLSLLYARRPACAPGVFSRCAGLFFLLPNIVEFRLNEFLSSHETPAAPDMNPPALIRYLLGLQILGQRRNQFATDAGLLCFAGLAQVPPWPEIQRWAESLSPAFHDAFLVWIAKSEERLRRELHYRDAFRKRHSPDDLSFLSAEDLLSRSPGLYLLDRTIAALANAILREFTARLGSFAESTIDYLVRNFFALSGEIAEHPQSITVTLAACPLQSLLRLTGFASSDLLIPEFAHRRLHFVFPGD